MKTFINKETGITQANEAGETSNMGFADIALLALNSQPQGGWDVKTMRERMKVMNKLENQELEASIELEDAEFNMIEECSKIKWKFFHKDIIAYDDYLSELKD